MIAETQFTVEDFRRRIQAITDEKLVCCGKAARYMADAGNSADKHTVRDVYVTQLQLCREEWVTAVSQDRVSDCSHIAGIHNSD